MIEKQTKNLMSFIINTCTKKLAIAEYYQKDTFFDNIQQ